MITYITQALTEANFPKVRSIVRDNGSLNILLQYHVSRVDAVLLFLSYEEKNIEY